MKACSISLLITFFRFRTGRLAGGCSGNTVGRQQIDSRCYAKFALDPCCQRVDKLPATFFVADPTLDLQNDFFLGGNKSNRIARMNFRFLFRNIFNILREELLEAGIDVFTTVNVQHLESLNDVVSGVTGIQVRETVPDPFFDAADDVVLVDLPPDDLRQRLKEGKVYIAGQAERAIEHFFRKGNLIALRR